MGKVFLRLIEKPTAYLGTWFLLTIRIQKTNRGIVDRKRANYSSMPRTLIKPFKINLRT